MENGKRIVGITGPCASGKTTLASNLKQAGYTAKPIAQEHSDIPDMWAKLSHPDVLIFLEISQDVAEARRNQTLRKGWLDHQMKRLSHARDHADLIINTDQYDADEVLNYVLAYLNQSS